MGLKNYKHIQTNHAPEIRVDLKYCETQLLSLACMTIKHQVTEMTKPKTCMVR